MKRPLLEIYRKLFREFGPQRWWPGDTPFEIIVGAILTQNTAWGNVEKAIGNLKRRKLLTPKSLSRTPASTIARLIRPIGYYNIKTKRLKNFLDFLNRECGGSLKNMFKLDTQSLRVGLLGINGIGQETADSILLYAANRPVFVVDAYTKRIFARHGLAASDSAYEDLQGFFMSNLTADSRLYNEYHALIVITGKEFCRKKPICRICPLYNNKTKGERTIKNEG